MLRRLLSLLRLRQAARRRRDPAWQSAIDFRPRIEQLEDRRVMAEVHMFHVSHANEDGQVAGSILVTRGTETSGSLTVNLNINTTLSTATSADFEASLPTSVVIPDGESGATVTLPPALDNLVEGTEAVHYELASGSGYTISATFSACYVNVIDDAPLVSIVGDESVNEGSGQDRTFTVYRSGGDVTQSLTVEVESTGDAVEATDFTNELGTGTHEIVIAADETFATFEIEPIIDALVEGTEAATYSIKTNSTLYVIDSETASAAVSITDSPPTLNVVAIDALAAEDPNYDGRTGKFRVTRSGGDLTQALEFSFTFYTPWVPFLSPFYAQSGADFAPPGSYTVTIPANETTWDFTVTPVNDAFFEFTENVQLELTAAPSTYALGENASATVKIYDNEKTCIENLFDPCMCGCPGVEMGVLEQLGGLMIHAADGLLTYLSTPQPHPIVFVDAAFEPPADEAESIEARLTFGTLDPVSVFYDPTGLVPYDEYRFALQVDAATLASGSYEWSLEIIEHYASSADITREYHGTQEVLNLDETVMGPGFRLSFLDSLAIQTEGVSLIGGSGAQTWFTKVGEAYTVQAGDPELSTLEFDDVAETYTLTTRSGVISIFDVAGLLQTRTDRFGNVESFTYADADSDTFADDLVSHTDFAGRETTFAYSGGMLDTITDFAGRVTTLGYTSGKLTSVTGPDPDGAGPAAAPVSTFTYDTGTGLMNSFTRPSGGATELAYNAARGLVSKTNPDETTVNYASEATMAVIDTSGTYGSESDPAALFASAGAVGSTENELGQATSYTTDVYGQRTSETNHLGQTTQYIRDADGRVLRLIGPEPSGGVDFQLIQDFEYENGNLASVKTVEGAGYGVITEYEYDATWNVVTSIMTYGGGGSPSQPLSWQLFTIDEATGAVLESRQVLGEPDDEINEETDDAVETFVYTAAPEDPGDPAAGLLASHTNSSGVTTLYDYNERGLVVEITVAAGTADEATLGFEYDSADNLTDEIDELGRRTEHTYNDAGQRQTTTLPDPDGAGPLAAPELAWEYNIMGRVTLAVDPLGRETEYVYGAFGNLVEQTLSGGSFDPVTLSWTYDDAGRNLSSTDGLGRTTTTTLDALGRTLTTTLPDPDSGGELESPVFSQTYSSLGSVATTTDALGNVTDTSLSNYGRTVTTTLPDPDGEGPLESPVYLQHFDLLGRLVEELSPTGGVTTYSYNMLSQLQEKVLPDPDGEGELESPVYSWTYDAAGNMLSETDPLGNTTEFVWNSRGWLLEKQLPDPDGAGALGIPIILYSYDSVGNLLSLTDPVANTTTWTFDALNRVIEEENELEASRFFVYDSAGRLIEKIDRNGRIIQYEYDLLDNVTSEKWYTGETLNREFTFTFDLGSQLLSAADSDSAWAFVYDDLGRTTEISAAYAGLTPEIVMAQTFDANSARSQLAVTLGETADFVNDFTRDILGRLTRLEQYGVGGGNSVAEKRVDFTYLADGRYDAISRYADLAGTESVLNTAYSYDDLGRLTLLAHSQDATPLASYEYVYDVGSRITSIDSLVDGLVENTYDNTSQLVGADFASQADETHEWDENGNHAGAGFDIGANNKIATDGTHNYEYDAEGNLILKTTIATGETVSFIWDHRNRLTGVVNRDDEEAITQEVHFAYDFLNRWIARTADADGAGIEDPTSLFFAYDGTQIVLELDSPTSEEPAHRYLWSEAVDHLLADENALGDVLHPLADHLNTVRDLAEYDAGENLTSIIDHIVYESFGKVVSESTPTPIRFKFTSRSVDEFTGLQSNWHRWYSVDLGWWLSEDPIGFEAGDANLGRYVGNSPVSTIDPTGLLGTLTVTFGEDRETNLAGHWNKISSYGYDRHLWIDPRTSDWSATLIAKLEQYKAQGKKFDRVVFAGHGNRAEIAHGAITPDLLSDKSSGAYKFLEALSQVVSDSATLDIRHCLVADGDEGKEFITTIADITGTDVTAPDDWYAIWPYGTQWTAKQYRPEGGRPTPGKPGPPFMGSLIQQIFRPDLKATKSDKDAYQDSKSDTKRHKDRF